MVTIDQGVESLSGSSHMDSQSFWLQNHTSPVGFDGKRLWAD